MFAMNNNRYRVAVVFATISTVSTTVTSVAAVSKSKPCPEAYPVSEVSGTHSRNPVKDPKGEIKFRNNGGSPMFVESIQILKLNKEVASFSKALGTESKTPLYSISSESENFLKGGCKGRSFQKNSSICLATVRPIRDEDSITQSWAKGFENDLSVNQVELIVKYRYFCIPFINSEGIFYGEKRIRIGCF